MDKTIKLLESKLRRPIHITYISEHILKKDMNETSESMVWREIDFSNNLCRKYPEQFMQIYRYENKKCNYRYKKSD